MLISPSKSSYIEYVIDQNYENLSERAIYSKYFGLQFKVSNYCFNTGIDDLDKIGSNFAISPHSDFGVMFALNKISYVETLVGFDKDINYIWINHISHFVYLDEIAMKKMLDHICENVNLDLTFNLFFSKDNLMRIALILDHDHHKHSSEETNLVLTFSDFSIQSNEVFLEPKANNLRGNFGKSDNVPDFIKG